MSFLVVNRYATNIRKKNKAVIATLIHAYDNAPFTPFVLTITIYTRTTKATSLMQRNEKSNHVRPCDISSDLNTEEQHSNIVEKITNIL